MRNKVGIKDAKTLADDLDQQAVMIIGVGRNGELTCVTYGENKLKCEAMGWWGQNTFEKNASAVPFQTIFGWGNNGLPIHLDEEQEAFIRKYWPKDQKVLRFAGLLKQDGIDEI